MKLLANTKKKIYHSAIDCKAHFDELNGVKVWTNGCFDLVHRGHIESLMAARDLGDHLIVGLNSDQSVAKLKGESRPIQDEHTRGLILASFSFVDVVLLFHGPSPVDELTYLRPDVFAKGGDYDVSALPEAQAVLSYGGLVKTLPFVENISSTDIINKISKRSK